MEVGALEFQRPENAREGFFAPSAIAGHLTALTASLLRSLIGVICIEPLLDRPARQVERLASHRQLQRSQIEFLDGLPPQ
ncbi:MAG: hypothetical protein JO062_00055 [Bryobacterales bacterium]|nr:hypothetical protein [Bryobacterales bacterium]